MKKFLILSFLICGVSAFCPAQDGKLNIIVIGAHPDDCDVVAGGTAILYSKLAHRVKFVSMTNGDAGHQSRRSRNAAPGGFSAHPAACARHRCRAHSPTITRVDDVIVCGATAARRA